ncbi:hypothetical protein BOTNAR_0611g00010 [Botryotinia narcissicola]|uniref:Uncharacterized protein n=1 Tax=Botryotinia narcissicola TaxID=278944 RepID=A0A4Z1HBD1_9HELO|nr:hypothetical protein BOTNAR_0611g00010 [Botryotinia narcissicola]
MPIPQIVFSPGTAAGTSARPQPACPGRRRGNLGYDIPVECHRPEPNCLEPYMNTLLHTGEAVAVLATAGKPARLGHVN